MKNRDILSRAAMMLLTMLLSATTAWAWDGSGTENDPYLITSYDDLLALRNNVNGGEAYDGTYFKQTADIDWPANTTWTSGIGTDESHRFSGHYDGDGKAIRRLTISGSSTYTALFGYVQGEFYHGGFKLTSLKNILLEDCDIQTTGYYASGICAFNPGNSSIRIDNCRVSGTIKGNVAAGICACTSNYATVENCRVSGTINGNIAAGGIVGENSGKVKNCFADVTVTASVQTVSPSGVTIQYCSVGKIIGRLGVFSINDTVTGNYYHDDGATDDADDVVTAIGKTGSISIADGSYATALYTVSGTGLTTAATNATVTHAGKHYFASGATVTLTTYGNNLISFTPSVRGTGTSVGSVATDQKSMTVIVGTSDVTVSATAAWVWSGDGTEDDPYLITSYDDLLALRNNVNDGEAYDGKYFKQTADIDWPANTTWTSGIGIDAAHRFGGHYDGDGKAIRRLTINGTSMYTALFGYVRGADNGSGGREWTTLKNIVLEDCNIDASSVSGSYAAGICAYIPKYTRIDNCRVSGTISATSNASGITCKIKSFLYVTNCFADVTVRARTIGKIFADAGSSFSSDHIVGNYYHDNGDGVGSTDPSTPLIASEAAPLYTISGSGLTVAATNATVTHAGKHYFAAGSTVTLTIDGNNFITGTPAVSGTGASLGSVATDWKSMTIIVGSADVTVTVSDGTEADPYLITSYDDLLALRNIVNNGETFDGKYFKQTADIDWPANTTWTSGIGTDADHRFGGHYDGDGKAIRHLTINGTSMYTALFGYVCGADNGSGGREWTTLKNILLEDCNIDASSVFGSYAAGICAGAYYTTVENCRVSGTINGNTAAGGIVGLESWSNVKDCFADVTVTALVRSSDGYSYCNVGKIIGYQGTFDDATLTGNYYHKDGATDGTGTVVTAFGRRVSSTSPGSSTFPDGSRATALYTVSGSGLTAAATNATVTYAGRHYFASGATATLTTDGNHLIIRTPAVSGTGASLGSVATDQKSMTVTVGTTDVTVSTTMQTIGGLCGDNATWSMSDTDGNGTYETLTISGTGAITSSPWAADFATTIQRVNISSADLTISGNPFNTLSAGVVIVVPTPAYAVNYSSAAYAAKLRVGVGSQLFNAIGTSAADAACEIANEQDLRNLAAAVNQDRQGCSGLTFRQTANITLSGTFAPIGFYTSNSNQQQFYGTYDGGGNTISGLSINTGNQYAGLFGRVSDGTVKNVHLISPTVTSSYESNDNNNGSRVGTIAGYTYNAHIENCWVYNPTVSATGSKNNYVGAIIGMTGGDVLTYLYFYKNAHDYAAIGYNNDASINCVDRAHTLTLGSGITTSTTPAFSYNSVDYYYGTVTLPAAPAGWIYAYTVNGSAIDGNTFIISGDATVACTRSINSADFSQSGNTYTIHTAAGWDVFCDALQDNTTYNRFSGKTVKLGADIEVSRMAGSSGHDFCGTFDGDGKTLTFNYGTNDTPASVQNVAPFSYVSNVGNVAATIKNLHVAGDIYTSAKYAAGIVGQHWGTLNIENCRSSIVIHSSTSGDGTHGGIEAASNGTLNITGCVFDGKLLTTGTTATTNCGGFVGYGTLNISNSLYAPAALAESETEITSGSNTFVRNSSAGSNCYYTRALGSVQGTQAYTERQSFPCKSVTILGTTVYYAADFTPFGKTDSYTPDGSADHPYIISTADGWEYFCDALQDNDTWNRFSGKTVKLGANIGTAQEPVTRMAGSQGHDFCGTFDGDGKTLTFTATAADNYCAPFRNVKGGSTADGATTISNLNVTTTITSNDYRHAAGLIALQSGHVNVSDCHANVSISSTKGTNNPTDLYPAALVSQASNGGTLTVTGCTATGTISTNGKYAAGLVGIVQGAASISDCVSSVTINSSTTGDGTHGGIVAVVNGSCTITGSVFNGKQITTATNSTGNCAGFIAWGNGSISNCLYAPTTIGTGETEVVAGTGDYPSGTFYRGSAPTVTNSYYTRMLGIAQGTAPRTIEAGEGITVSNIALTGTTTAYTTSGITAYSGGGLSYAGNIYYGSGDKVPLTLSNTATVPTGYQFDGYAASNGGTLTGTENPYTLTMPDADVTVSVAWKPINYTVHFDGNGSTDGSMADQTFTYDEAQQLTANAFSLMGYTFAGWNTQADGKGTSYDDEQSVSNLTATVGGSVTLYAQWTLTPPPTLPGDANGDGQVNVTDIMAVANYILNIGMTVFDDKAADVNGDNVVNVTDIMGIANIILNVTPSSNSRANSEVEDTPEPQ